MKLLLKIIKEGIELPTLIQSASIPILMSGNNMIGCSKTGSGKTFAYGWPMIIHVANQISSDNKKDGPVNGPMNVNPTKTQ